jgi:tetratricopeptide (TPR) repeat protein
LLRQQGRPDDAVLEFETVLAFDRNSVGALFHLGWCKVVTGSLDEGIPLAERGIRLSPRDPLITNFYWRIGWVYLLESHAGDAVLWLEKARNANPRLAGIHAYLAAAYSLKGESERASAELAEARRLNHDDRYSSIARLSRGYWGVPKVRALFEATYFAGLRKAGMPEE